MKKLLVLFSFVFLAACGGGGSDSGGMVIPTLPGTNVPASFAGVYTGTLNLEASALGITERESYPITVTVTDNAMVRFDIDGDSVTVGLANDGEFRANLPVPPNSADCTGTIGIEGSVDGTTASGTLSGEGRCNISGLTADVTLSGDFSATR